MHLINKSFSLLYYVKAIIVANMSILHCGTAVISMTRQPAIDPCGSSIITLPAVLVVRTIARFVIAESVDVGTANVNTRGIGVGRRVERVAEAVCEIGAAVGCSVVAVAVGMPVAVQELARAGVIRLRPARRHHALLIDAT